MARKDFPNILYSSEHSLIPLEFIAMQGDRGEDAFYAYYKNTFSNLPIRIDKSHIGGLYFASQLEAMKRERFKDANKLRNINREIEELEGKKVSEK